MGAVEERSQLTLVALHLTTLAVAVEVALGRVVGFTVGVVVDRSRSGPLIATTVPLRISSLISRPSPGFRVKLT
jgi:hypothetical protein